ncbi:MAG TPA: SUMF1/EgtB/PvdO family nonheme iron enzyme [Bryobacteraceae bacterium]|nr:SUMF1/EgtB/PvdO family nonheme iron enzyme [Bryobacteraceae bacterium]
MKLSRVFYIALVAGVLSAADFVTLPYPQTGSSAISPFSVSTSEVTQAEYKSATNTNPSFNVGDHLPVENVSWWDAIRYCNRRSEREGLEPCYNISTGACDRTRNGYRLLTDAEWAYAAGKAPGQTEIRKYANLGDDQTKDTRMLLERLRSTGTVPAGTLLANEYGLFNTIGNVWEWVQDGVSFSKGIRGGSYISSTSRWGAGYRSSMEPDRKSRFTGFRVCRTVSGDLAPLLTSQDWKERRRVLQKQWTEVLGMGGIEKPPVSARLSETHEETEYTGKLMYLQVEKDYWEKIYVMLPPGKPTKPLPVVIVPYYDIDTPAGKNLGGRVYNATSRATFGLEAVRRGFAAVAVRWFGESYGEHYAEAVANLKLRHPKLTGLGKWVWDSQRLIDYLQTLPELDTSRIGIIGHSLGGKMALYAAAFDERIGVTVSSEPGIGLSFSNYEDFWYLGEQLDRARDHHELLALIAPRPFLLIAGDSADSNKSLLYLNAAKPVYALSGATDRLGFLNHRQGHPLTAEAVTAAMDFLQRYLQ